MHPTEWSEVLVARASRSRILSLSPWEERLIGAHDKAPERTGGMPARQRARRARYLVLT